ncbi:hypothetical protein E5Q_03318 [Mixia osmundae IAM 14324]|uniref:acetylornithine transaminase n=2 Tax=Mixia osmundae (strain CBS 9802 / IAM 14324 / JCM 22182 / KY 12970) TaxID=764103 RepID=G7E1D7_MIXOS|nr:hypothetical protein E5Q_03318 [Mixia osmundae IAM 14324]
MYRIASSARVNSLKSKDQFRCICKARSSFSTTAQSHAPSANSQYLKVTHSDETAPTDTLQSLARHARYTLNTYVRPPIMFESGKGMYLHDTQGREYLDMSAGIAVNALGHSDEGVAEAMSKQARRLVHVSNLYHNEWAGELAQLLVESTIASGGLGTSSDTFQSRADKDTTSGLKVFFANSGTEANEGALKFVRKYGKLTAEQHPKLHGKVSPHDKVEVVAFRDGFHGRSMGALSVTLQEKYQAPFAPLIPEIMPGQLNDIESINKVVTEKTCGVIVEPIQGEGGILEATEEFMRALRKRCDEVGAALIFDEIQCGLGRTGKLWAHCEFPADCHPDIVTMAKPLANGMPIGAILMTDKIADIVKIGDHGTTFGGGPLQTCVGHHVVSRITKPEFLDHVKTVGAQLKQRLSALPELFPKLVTGDIRGRGLILGVPFASDGLPPKVAKMCRERGVIVLTCGKATLRFVPSLIIEKAQIDHACDVLESVLTVIQQEAH